MKANKKQKTKSAVIGAILLVTGFVLNAQDNLSLNGSIHEGINVTNAANTIDGTSSTATVGTSTTATLTIRLDNMYNICTIDFNSSGSDNDMYHLFTSDTGDPWDFDYINTYFDPPTITNLDREIQYVRFMVYNNSTSSSISISEVEIYGCLDPIAFDYDDSGNRKERTVKIEVKKAWIEDFEEPDLTDEIGEVNFSMYPNPTKGVVTVEIENLTPESDASIRVYDLNGRQIYVNTQPVTSNTIDLTGYRAGMYIMVLKVGDKKSEWKIIKE